MSTSVAPLGAVALALTLAGCVESGRAETTPAGSDCPWTPDESVETTARIAWQAIPNADAVVKDRGILEACMPNATIEWVQAASGGDVVKYYGSGDVDLGLMGSSPATIASSPPVVNDVDLAVIWVHDVIGDAESLIVRGPAVTDISQLKGKAIAVPFSSTAHYSLLQALADSGLDATRDVEVINLDPEKMPAAWQGDEIDAAWVWDPVQSQLIAEGGERLLSSADTAEQGRPTFDLGTADRTFLAENPEFMTQWAKAQDWGIRLIEEDAASAAESVAVVLGIEPDEAEKQFAGLTYVRAADQAGPDFLGGKLAKDLETTARFLLEQGGIAKVAPAEQYAERVDAGPAERAAE
jgi:taurine transport system substrate-binding protein